MVSISPYFTQHKKTPASKFYVFLSNVGNPLLGQNANMPLPKTLVHKLLVHSLLEARTMVLEYIRDGKLGIGNWNGGAVTRQNGSQIAYISYNGRIWTTPLQNGKRAPFAPIVDYNARKKKLTICYNYIFKEIELDDCESDTCTWRCEDPLDLNSSIEVKLQVCSQGNGFQVSLWSKSFEGILGWQPSSPTPIFTITIAKGIKEQLTKSEK